MTSKEACATFGTAQNMRPRAAQGARKVYAITYSSTCIADVVILSSQTATSNAPLPNQKTCSPNHAIIFTQRTWSPNHGIVFPQTGISSSCRELSTLTAAEIEDGCLLHSHAEDNYVMASALESRSALKPTASIAVETEDAPPKVSAEVKTEHSKSADSASPMPPMKITEESVPDPRQNELPQTSTSYKMTEELFRVAKNAEPGTPDAYWSHALYRSPDVDGKTKRPTVHYCRSLKTTEKVLKQYFMDKKVIGFDIEWKPDAYRNMGPRPNVSLVQIACEDRIALFHIALYPKGNKIEDLVAPTFKKIMEDPEVTKIGVSIKADCTRVRKFLEIDSHGLFELSHLYKLVKFSESKDFTKINKKLVSLANQVQEHLHLPMYKGDGVRSSDWSKPLNLAQISYAASDSYAGLQLYHTLELKRRALDPTPPRPYHADLNMPIRLAEGLEIPVDGEGDEVEPDQPEPARVKRKYARRAPKEMIAEAESIKVEDPDTEYVPSPETVVEYPTLPPP